MAGISVEKAVILQPNLLRDLENLLYAMAEIYEIKVILLLLYTALKV